MNIDAIQKSVDLILMVENQATNGNYDMVLVDELNDIQLTTEELLMVEAIINTVNGECKLPGMLVFNN